MGLHQLTLLADIGDLLQGLLPIIVAVLYGIAHLVGQVQQQKRRAAAKPRPAPPQDFVVKPQPERRTVAAADSQPTLEETLRREVEEFLRRSQGQPTPQAKNQSQPQRLPPSPARPRPAAPSRPARQTDQRSRLPEQPRRVAETAGLEAVKTLAAPLNERVGPTSAGHHLGAGVSQYVTEQLRGTQQLAQHAQNLGADVAQADERMQQHLQQRFVHSVGTLAPVTAAVGEQRAASMTAAQELKALLSRPNGAKQLIIASEILRRPDERWNP